MPSYQNKPKLKSCPRCSTPFECKACDVAKCQCSGVQIGAATLDFLAGTHYECLCKDCLVELDRMVELAQSQDFPQQPEALTEGLHYYVENGLFVFTEFYHLLRGSCCQSGCRHCAYGFKGH